MVFRFTLTTLLIMALSESSMAYRIVRRDSPNSAAPKSASDSSNPQSQVYQANPAASFQAQTNQAQANQIAAVNQAYQAQAAAFANQAYQAEVAAIAANQAYQAQPVPAIIANQPIQSVNEQAAFKAAQFAQAKSIPAPSNLVADQQAEVVQQSYDFNPVDNSFVSSFQTNNGIAQQSRGYVNANGNYVMEGSYSSFTKEGVPVSISYIADENGYQASGDAIPQPDQAVAKAVAYQKSLPKTNDEKA